MSIMAALVAAAPAWGYEPSPDPYSYAMARGCRYVHPSSDSYRATRRLLKHERPVGPDTKHRVHKWAVCVATRRKAHAVHEHVRRLWAWRHSYSHRWPITFNRLPSYGQSWAWSTGACESGNNPATSTGNGFYGAFQWVPSTWYSAGGDRFPTLASWHHQAVLAWTWHLGHPSGQWPNCGE